MTNPSNCRESPAANQPAVTPHITSRYLLVINIPLYRDGNRTVYAEQLWFKDLAAHLSYIDNLVLACPVSQESPPSNAVPLESDSRFARLRIMELPDTRSTFGAMLALPRTVRRLWRAVRAAEIIHAGVAGWPIPYAWLVTPIAKLAKRKLVIIVESAPWRLDPGQTRRLKASVTASIYERMARWCLRRADLSIFTQDEYRKSLLTDKSRNGHVIHASWIDSDTIISDEDAKKIWREKIDRAAGGLKIIFAGRLERQKGVLVLLEAIRLAASKNIVVTLDLLGSGDLAGECADVSGELRGATRLNVLGTVSYGAPLFELLRNYHAVIVPSISDEQPRIVYDAYSQGLPALASNTAGLRDCVRDGSTGWLFTPGDAVKLCNSLAHAAENLEELRRMGSEGLRAARAMTHQRMHHDRQILMSKIL